MKPSMRPRRTATIASVRPTGYARCDECTGRSNIHSMETNNGRQDIEKAIEQGKSRLYRAAVEGVAGNSQRRKPTGAGSAPAGQKRRSAESETGARAAPG